MNPIIARERSLFLREKIIQALTNCHTPTPIAGVVRLINDFLPEGEKTSQNVISANLKRLQDSGALAQNGIMQAKIGQCKCYYKP